MEERMNAFEWRGQPAQIHIEDTSRRRHKRGMKPDTVALSNSSSTTVAQLDMAGNVLKVYPSLAAAARDLGLHVSGISLCINGKRTAHGGYRWSLHKPMGSRR
jgi:hypothetical protein